MNTPHPLVSPDTKREAQAVITEAARRQRGIIPEVGVDASDIAAAALDTDDTDDSDDSDEADEADEADEDAAADTDGLPFRLKPNMTLSELRAVCRRYNRKQAAARAAASGTAAMSLATDSPNGRSMTPERARDVLREHLRDVGKIDSPFERHRKITETIRRIQQAKDGRHDAPTFVVTIEQLATEIQRLAGLFRAGLDSWAEWVEEVRDAAEAAGFFKNDGQVPRYADRQDAAMSLSPPGTRMSDDRLSQVISEFCDNTGIREPQPRPRPMPRRRR